MESDSDAISVDENARTSDTDSDSDLPLIHYKTKLTEEELAECRFMSKEKVLKALKFVSNNHRGSVHACKHNILAQQRSKIANRWKIYSKSLGQNWKRTYLNAINEAIYSHDWNKLCYILKKSLHWDINKRFISETVYTRALTILLMYHPSAQSQSLLSHYMHMALSCRSDQDKKALYKVLLSMRNKLLRHRTIVFGIDDQKIIECATDNYR